MTWKRMVREMMSLISFYREFFWDDVEAYGVRDDVADFVL
uniref:Uncharacterized protein n=1 Tax=Arundo donax TaxID=35708 RepID=A0A0A8ZGJ6_ARUDO